MTKNDIESILKDNQPSKKVLSASEMVNIMSYVNPKVEIDRNSMEYYYKISINDLVNSDMPLSDLDDLKNEGWSIDTNSESIILFF